HSSRAEERLQLCPRGVIDIYDRVFSMYRQRALLFAALAAVPYLALFLVIGGIALSLGSQLTPLAPFLDSLSVRTTTGAPNLTITPAIASAFFTLIVFGAVASLVSVLFLSVPIRSP